jgi:hypothetical protein
MSQFIPFPSVTFYCNEKLPREVNMEFVVCRVRVGQVSLPSGVWTTSQLESAVGQRVMALLGGGGGLGEVCGAAPRTAKGTAQWIFSIFWTKENILCAQKVINYRATEKEIFINNWDFLKFVVYFRGGSCFQCAKEQSYASEYHNNCSVVSCP